MDAGGVWMKTRERSIKYSWTKTRVPIKKHQCTYHFPFLYSEYSYMEYFIERVHCSVDSQAAKSAISRPGYSYQALLLHDTRKATFTLLLSGSAAQVGWTPSYWQRACYREKPPSRLQIPLVVLHLRSQIRSQLLWERQIRN